MAQIAVSERLTAGHGALTAVRTGTGRDLVVLHTLLVDRHSFDAVLPALAEKHRVTLINMPGFHGSQPTVLPLMDAYIAAIEDGFEEFGIGPDAILIGNGFGAIVALAFALAHPEQVAKLVLCGVAAGYSDANREQFTALADKVKAGGLAAITDAAVARVFSPAYLAAHPEKVGEHKKALLGLDPKALINAYKVLGDLDLTPSLARLQMPTLVVCGELDLSTPPALSKAVAEKIAGAKYIELPGCGHCPPLEQPETFLAAIKDFTGL